MRNLFLKMGAVLLMLLPTASVWAYHRCYYNCYTAPEINASEAGLALALLIGVVLLVAERSRRT